MPATTDLATMYQTAMLQGHATGDHVYVELLDAIHVTAKAIATGYDVETGLKELVEELRADAFISPPMGRKRLSAWADFLEASL